MNVTREMLDFYEARTNNHIELVKKNLYKLANKFSYEDLRWRAVEHDKSKASKEEYLPYVFFTWHKKYPEFDFTIEMQEAFDMAWVHHYQNNDHHCEFWVPPRGRCPVKLINNISKEAMIEMCCDVHAMSQEFNDNAVDFLVRNHFKKYPFSDDNKLFMLNVMSNL